MQDQKANFKAICGTTDVGGSRWREAMEKAIWKVGAAALRTARNMCICPRWKLIITNY